MKIKILSLICLAFSLVSCNKWLSVELIDRVDEEKLFSTSAGFHEALAGAYSQMSKANLYGKDLTMGYMDTYAQYYNASDASDYKYHSTYDYLNSGVASQQSALWNSMYSVISAANNVIRWTDKNGGVLSPSEKQQIIGEAIAIRAFIHFDLIRMFCPDIKHGAKERGIPYNKTFGVSLPQMYTVEECVQLVLNDLDEAETFFANDPIKTTKPFELATKNEADKFVARMNIYAVKALKARLYLMRGDYTNAIKYATEVVESGQFALLNFVDADKPDKEIDILFSDEHIFSLRNKDIPEATKKLFEAVVTESTTTNPPISFKSTGPIFESNVDDIRYVSWFNLANKDMDNGGGYKFSKYTKDNSDLFFPKIPIIKLSEMYLILAEAYFSRDVDKSLEYINTLRDHRIRNNAKWQYLTKDYIFEEMTREFLSEGQLFYAYKRLNKKISTGTSAGDLEPSDNIYVFPLPKKEIESGNR